MRFPIDCINRFWIS